MINEIILITSAALLGGLSKFLYDMRKDKLIETNRKLFEISNNLRELRNLFRKCHICCEQGDYEQYYEYRKSFIDLHDKTSHFLYFYYYELKESYASALDFIVNQLDEMETIYKARQNKDNLKVERNLANEFIYEDQYLLDIDKYFNQLHTLIKYKKDHPYKKMNFKTINENTLYEYHP